MHYSPTLAGGDVPLLYGIRTHLRVRVPGRWRVGCRNCLLYRGKKIFMRRSRLPTGASGYLQSNLQNEKNSDRGETPCYLSDRHREPGGCSTAEAKEKSNADSTRTATASRPRHRQPCADATRIFLYLARGRTAETAAGTLAREAFPGFFLRQHQAWTCLCLYDAGGE